MIMEALVTSPDFTIEDIKLFSRRKIPGNAPNSCISGERPKYEAIIFRPIFSSTGMRTE